MILELWSCWLGMDTHLKITALGVINSQILIEPDSGSYPL